MINTIKAFSEISKLINSDKARNDLDRIQALKESDRIWFLCGIMFAGKLHEALGCEGLRKLYHIASGEK